MWRESLTHQIMIRIKCFSFNPFQECCTVASDESGKAVIVDPGCYDENEISVLTSYIAGSGLQIEKILLTHGHFDHIFGVSALAERYDVPVLMSPRNLQIRDVVLSVVFPLAPRYTRAGKMSIVQMDS